MAQLIFEPIEKEISGVGMGFKGHRWRNSFSGKKNLGDIYIYNIYNTNMCDLQYKQTKMVGHVVKLVKNIYPYVHLLEWQLRHLSFHFKVG